MGRLVVKFLSAARNKAQIFMQIFFTFILDMIHQRVVFFVGEFGRDRCFGTFVFHMEKSAGEGSVGKEVDLFGMLKSRLSDLQLRKKKVTN